MLLLYKKILFVTYMLLLFIEYFSKEIEM